MNFFLKESIEYAQQRTYLDDLYSVYPTINNSIRDIDTKLWKEIETSYNNKDNVELMEKLLNIKSLSLINSNVANLDVITNAIRSNTKIANDIAVEARKIFLNDLFVKLSKSKNIKRQIGTMFSRWVAKTYWGFPLMNYDDFCSTDSNAICLGTRNDMTDFAKGNLCYTLDKDIDFLARIRGRYVIGNVEFFTDNGSNHIEQLNDAMAIVESRTNAVKVAILDGAIYRKNNSKTFKDIMEIYSHNNIMSALLLRDFLYTVN